MSVEARNEAAKGEFFRSRWVERPEHVSELEPTALPEGFRAAGVAAGIKEDGLDVGVLVSDRESTASAARFTTNALVGAPVAVSRTGNLARLRAIAASSGNANVADGDRGIETARLSRVAAGEALGVDPRQVGLASTGQTAVELPRDPLLAGIREAAEHLEEDAKSFSEAIVTTDRWPKRACLKATLPSDAEVTLSAQAKGAGMLSPRFATMFCFVQTDAELAPETVELLTGVCVKRSFDRISVDGQLSTSDTVYTIANGASGVAIEPESPDELALGEAMDALMRQLALEIVADGEGSKRIARIVVRGDSEDVEGVARAVADSPLVKTQLHGADPNFGRILQAAGQVLSGPGFHVDLSIEGRLVVSGGAAVSLDSDAWRALEEAVGGDEVEYALTVPGEGGETEVFFSDLSCDYVKLNSEYST